jgi:uncharacterized protein YfiM (DUF2279 family)
MELQASVSKEFAVTERWRMELRANAFNATNRLNRADPDLGVTSSTSVRRSANGAITSAGNGKSA